MKKKKNKSKLAVVNLVRTIRKRLGCGRWEMHKLLGLESIQAYIYLENETKAIRLPLLLKLHEISQLSDFDFWALVKEEARKEQIAISKESRRAAKPPKSAPGKAKA